MKTQHRILAEDARRMEGVPSASVDLVVTSPPYPMIEMWDEVFAAMSPEVGDRLARGEGDAAFELMHRELDRAWAEVRRVLRPGGIACINVGDATRTVAGDFRLYSNHSRILEAARRLGLETLPDVLWRKQTNAPNKFLGSGTLPCGAYVTYEHEYILILRKGPLREFPTDELKRRRRESAFFWEERNVWFSDVWLDLKGTSQDLTDPESRRRSAAFPVELPWRLIQMHSLAGDTVLDPFLGTGTTSVAAAATARSSIGLEPDDALRDVARTLLRAAPRVGTERLHDRIAAHRRFVAERGRLGKVLRHASARYGFPVVTAQETDVALLWPLAIHETSPGAFEAEHSEEPPESERLHQAEFPFLGP